MAKFMIIRVGDVDRLFSAENVITVASTAATTTAITYSTGSASTDILTLTHTDDSAADPQVFQAVNTTLLALHDPTGKRMGSLRVQLPSGITVSTAVLA